MRDGDDTGFAGCCVGWPRKYAELVAWVGGEVVLRVLRGLGCELVGGLPGLGCKKEGVLALTSQAPLIPDPISSGH